jgi:hypothetical protein
MSFKAMAISAFLALGIATAAPEYNSMVFDPANNETTVQVSSGNSATATVNIEADRLLDALEQIRLDYGAELTGLQIKEVVAPAGIKLELDSQSIDTATDELTLEFTVTAENTNSGSFPVRIVMENPQTGEVTSFDLTVQVDTVNGG